MKIHGQMRECISFLQPTWYMDKKITEDKIMYCGKCGREIPDDAGFCPHCGNATGNIAGNKSKGTSLKLSGMQQIAGGISVIIWIILDFAFFITCLSHYSSNMDAFDWVSDTAKMMGIIVYFLMAAAVLPDCIKAIKRFLDKKQDGVTLIANGVSTLLYAFALQICSWLFNDWSNSDISIVLYRIFGTYKGMVVPLVLAAVAFFVLGAVVMCGNKEK